MAYLPLTLPAPAPSMDERPVWEHCARQRLTFQRCADGARFRHPPIPVCPHCQSTRHEWAEAPQTGEVYTYTIVHHPAHPDIGPHLPYNVVVVAFPECDGVRLVSNVIDVPPEELRVGLRVRLAWEAHGEGMYLPRFNRA